MLNGGTQRQWRPPSPDRPRHRDHLQYPASVDRRPVHGGERVAIEADVDVADNPNDLARRLADDEVVVQRITVRPELLRQSLVDDHDGRPAFIPLRECAATEDWNF